MITSTASSCGLTPTGGGFVIEDALEQMIKHLQHRGPDDRGSIVLPEDGVQVAFGHTRLSILDLSPAGHQPMSDPLTGNWITYNGEIYNYRDVRRVLTNDGEAWKSHTDTEVILKAYAKQGRHCLEQLRGMFAFAIWDAQKRKLFLARDRLGIKPLYYYSGNGFFVFASEVKTLLASGLVPRRLDPVALWQYLAYQSIPAPRTLVRGVQALLPGAWLTVDASHRTCQDRYWTLSAQALPEAQAATEDESRRRVGELLREAVALHLVSDVPVGAFLSGGIDSSALVALTREAGQIPQTFSVIFSEGNYDEARFARQVAATFQAEHTEIHLTEQDLLDCLPGALEAMDQPTGDGVNTYVVSQAVRSAGMKVALSGLGGDEFFAGYPSFSRFRRAAGYLRLWGQAPYPLRAMAAKTLGALGGFSVSAAKTAAILESDGTLAEIFPLLRQVLPLSHRRALLRESWLQLVAETQDPYTPLLHDAFSSSIWSGLLAQISYAEGRTYMHDVLLRDTDQMSMAHALEVRVPLLDHKLVEYLMGLPDAYKQSNGTPKRLLVESLGGLLPAEIVHRPKQGFTLPFDPWIRGALRKFCEERLSPERIGCRGVFRPEQVQKIWRSFLSGRSDISWSRVWVLVVLEEWLEQSGVTCEPGDEVLYAEHTKIPIR